ncbi:peptide/nickel transport system substrate-binding protein [Virgibacillus natechei]|uniref:Peptide/nickel transport system substrate-binding protein n=1 Tax=Virgibacillus natechei TaxID=1216297 RepID=A0ABS4IGY1_9BACI|nr:glutathione ABC transporter substrate-binding protein [Virgibacillus natechei]MBP1970201.1 peptide/nickel transport system substrate-binding protein [Virgibacillus natechei]UZD12848.1 glutathione ABC transporter substrate-binding protein [Virgibacillus natechei]
MKENPFKILVLLLALSVALIACASEPDDEEASGEAETEGDSAEEAGDDLIIGTGSDAASLDPHTSSDVPSGNIQINIYETLLKFDEDMELEPLLAKDWEAIEDDVWEFELEEGVTFHDGSEFNAEVVKMNVERILDEELASPRAVLFDLIEEVIVVDDHTVQLVTEDPFAPLPAHFAHYASSILSPEIIEADYAAVEEGEQHGAYVNENPVGTGMFEFESWDPGAEIVLANNEDYWGDNANVDTVTFKVVPEDLTRVAEMETGDSHIIDPLTASDMGQIENAEEAHVYMRDAASITYLGFNMQKEPFDDPLVRQAISKVVDREAMIEGILEGTGEEAVGPINETQFGYSEDVEAHEYDIEEAKDLLAEAGYEDGFETEIWTNDSQERIDIATYTQNELAEIGIDASIEIVEWGAYLDSTANGEHEMFILGLSLGTADADYPLHMMFHSHNVGATGNRSFMEDETFDEMLHEARVEQDEDTRLELYVEATEYLNEQAPMAFLYHPAHIMAHRDNVEGFWADASGLYQLQDVTLN